MGSKVRRSKSQGAGLAFALGPPEMTRVLEAALRKQGPVERVTHGFHTWPAGLHPDAAQLLLTLGQGPVLDPFCGGGTVLIEALLAGRPALGLDISPVACMVSRARTTLTTEEQRTAMRSGARRATEAARFPANDIRLPNGVEKWYLPHVAAELAVIKASIGNDPLLRTIFSSVLIKTSLRESDTRNTRTDKERPEGTAAVLFHQKARAFARQLEELAAKVPPGVQARVHREDAREFRSKERFGMVVTSPPYPGIYDYLPMQQLRHLWLDLEADEAAEIGARRAFRQKSALQRWEQDTVQWLRAVSKVTDGPIVIVIGDGHLNGVPVDALETVLKAADVLKLRCAARVSVERWDGGLGVVRPEHALVLVSPPPAP